MGDKTQQKILRTVLLGAAALFQIAVLILSYAFFKEYTSQIQWIFELLSLLIVFYIIRSDINPAYKIPWIVLLLVFPVFGGFIYFTYGKYRFSRGERERMYNTAIMCHEAITSRPFYNDELEGEDAQAGVQAGYLLNNADSPAYKNSTGEYFPLGDMAFPIMLEELSNAEKFIFMEYFIVEDGEMLNPILDILLEKAKKGVEVRFMFDSFGSISKAPVNLVRNLEAGGIQCFEFNTFKTILDNRYNNRDHRKICVIDGNTAFTGGINLADEYINVKSRLGHWKDNAILVRGEAVWSFTVEFLGLWCASRKSDENFYKYIPTKEFDYRDGYMIPYTDYPIDKEPVGKNVYLNIINRARKYIYIMTPYLVIDNIIQTALENAVKNGVDVRIVIPGIPDKKAVFLLTKSYGKSLVQEGVSVYEYDPGFVHSKLFLADDEIAVVGTINLDYRSLTHHYENALWMYKTEAVKAIKADFEETFSVSHVVSEEEIKEKTLLERMLVPFLRLVSPLL